MASKDFGSYCKVLEVVRAGVLGVTNAGTTAIDMQTCRQGWLIISLNVGSDVATSFVLQHSDDNSTWATLKSVDNADLAADALKKYDLANMKRYVRATWTRAAAAGDSYWAVLVVGDLAVRAPIS